MSLSPRKQRMTAMTHKNRMESWWFSRVAVGTMQKTKANRCRFHGIKSELSLVQTVALFRSVTAGCRCFEKRLLPVRLSLLPLGRPLSLDCHHAMIVYPDLRELQATMGSKAYKEIEGRR